MSNRLAKWMLATMISVPFVAQAKPGNYLANINSHGYGALSAGELQSSAGDSTAFDIRLGYELSPWLAAEVQAGKTKGSNADKFMAGSIVAKSRGPIYVRGQLGYGNYDPHGGKDNSDIVYGAGVGYQYRRNIAAELNYLQLPETNDQENEYISVGVKFSF